MNIYLKSLTVSLFFTFHLLNFCPIMQKSGKRTCSQFPECSLYCTNIVNKILPPPIQFIIILYNFTLISKPCITANCRQTKPREAEQSRITNKFLLFVNSGHKDSETMKNHAFFLCAINVQAVCICLHTA